MIFKLGFTPSMVKDFRLFLIKISPKKKLQSFLVCKERFKKHLCFIETIFQLNHTPTDSHNNTHSNPLYFMYITICMYLQYSTERSVTVRQKMTLIGVEGWGGGGVWGKKFRPWCAWDERNFSSQLALGGVRPEQSTDSTSSLWQIQWLQQLIDRGAWFEIW